MGGRETNKQTKVSPRTMTQSLEDPCPFFPFKHLCLVKLHHPGLKIAPFRPVYAHVHKQDERPTSTEFISDKRLNLHIESRPKGLKDSASLSICICSNKTVDFAACVRVHACAVPLQLNETSRVYGAREF